MAIIYVTIFFLFNFSSFRDTCVQILIYFTLPSTLKFCSLFIIYLYYVISTNYIFQLSLLQCVIFISQAHIIRNFFIIHYTLRSKIFPFLIFIFYFSLVVFYLFINYKHLFLYFSEYSYDINSSYKVLI